MRMVLIEISNNLKPLGCQTTEEEHAEMLVIPSSFGREEKCHLRKKLFFSVKSKSFTGAC